jgi:hypothetical protein
MSAAELNEYTLERVKTNTCAYQQLLRTAPVAGEDATAIELACDRLSSYLDLILERLHDWAGGPVDLLALVTRDLLELVFWVEYVLETEENAKRFLEEQRIDLAELVKKAVSAFEAEAGGMFDESPAGLSELLAEKGKRISATGRSALDAYTFKLCSKYIHPSSWLLMDLKSRLNSEMNRKLFWMMSLRYAAHISALLVLKRIGPEVNAQVERTDIT